MDKSIVDILRTLLKFDHKHIASNLQFIQKNNSRFLSLDQTKQAINALNKLSVLDIDESKQYFITIAALLWEYHNPEYDGLKDIIVLLLSKIGYAPSSIVLDDADNKQIPGVSSLISQIEADANHSLYELKLKDKIFVLTDFQYSLWKMLDNTTVGVSAPTSAGKSFVLLLKAADWVINDSCDIVYIVPTISLVNQVTADFIGLFKSLDYFKYKIRNSYSDEKTDIPRIYVMTQEKVLSSFSVKDNPFDRKMALIVDEIQNIERIEEETDELRSKILYDIINEFRYSENVARRVISGPRIKHIDIVAAELFGEETAKSISTDVSPVLNITYSVKKIENEYHFNQYCVLSDQAQSLKISNTQSISGICKKLYTPAYYCYLLSIINSLGPTAKNIIFAPTSAQAKKIAIEISSTRDESDQAQLCSLSDYLKSSVRDNYELSNTVKRGVIYHHGKLPVHVRKVIEKATIDRLVDNVVCTTTLMQGVNLPAQNIIIRNPHLYINKNQNSAELSNYEMANLRGRAGRLLKDFIGRTFVLDENEFLNTSDEPDQINLFEDTKKELTTGYGVKFEHNRKEIINAFENNSVTSQLDDKYGYLVVYIRQCILRYGKNALEKLNDVGIRLSKNELTMAEKSLAHITVDKSLCLKNRYWDPLILDRLFQDKNLPSVPTNVSDKRISVKLRAVLKYLRDSDDYCQAYEKHIPSSHRSGKMLTLLCDTTESWLKGAPLSVILSKDYYNDSENIDNTIKLIQNTVSFSVPVLLRPIYDIQKVDSSFLHFIECGAYQKNTRTLIEAGVPRETAIYLHKTILKGKTMKQEVELIESIKYEINNHLDEIPYWIKVQLNTLI